MAPIAAVLQCIENNKCMSPHAHRCRHAGEAFLLHVIEETVGRGAVLELALTHTKVQVGNEELKSSIGHSVNEL